MTTVIGGKLMKVDKSAFRNVVMHTDTHNRIKEVDEMWKQHGKQNDSEEGEDKPDLRSKLRAKKVYNRQIDTSEGKKSSTGKIGHWTKQLMDFEEKDPDRWGHSGFKELYPEEFGNSNSQSVKRNDNESASKEAEEKEEDIVEKWKKGRFRPKVESRRSFIDRNGATRGRGGFRGSYRGGFAVERTRQREFERERREPWKRSRSHDKDREQENRRDRKEQARRSRSTEKEREKRERLPGRFNRERSRSRERQQQRNENKVGLTSRETRKNSDEEYEEETRPRDNDNAKQRKESVEVRGNLKGRWDQRGDREKIEPNDVARSKWRDVTEGTVEKDAVDAEKKEGSRKGRWDQIDSSKDIADRKDHRGKGDEEKENEYLRKELGAKGNDILESHDVDAFGRDISKRNEYRKEIKKGVDKDLRHQERSSGGFAVKSNFKEDSISIAGESAVEEQADVDDEANGNQGGDVDGGMKVSDSATESISGLKGRKKKKKKHRKIEKRKRKEMKKHKKRKDKIKDESNSEYEERDLSSNRIEESEARLTNDVHGNAGSRYAMQASLNVDVRRAAILRQEVMCVIGKGIELMPLTPKAEQVLARSKTGGGSENEEIADVSGSNKGLGNRLVGRNKIPRSSDISDNDRSTQARKLSSGRADEESRKRQRKKEESDPSWDDDCLQDKEKHRSSKHKASVRSKERAEKLHTPDLEVTRSRTRKRHRNENDSDISNDEVEKEKGNKSRKSRADESRYHKGARRGNKSSHKHEETSDSDSDDDSEGSIRYRSSKVHESDRKRLVEAREVPTKKQRRERRKRESSSSKEDSQDAKNRKMKRGRKNSFDVELKHKLRGRWDRSYSESISEDEKRVNSRKTGVSKQSVQRKDREESFESDQRVRRKQSGKSSESDSSSETDSHVQRRRERKEKKSDRKNEKRVRAGREGKLKGDLVDKLKSKREESSETDDSIPPNRKSSKDKELGNKKQGKKERDQDISNRRKIGKARNREVDSVERKRSSTRRKRDSKSESDSERRKLGRTRHKEEDFSERKNSSKRKKRDSLSASDDDSKYKDVREMANRRKTGRGRDTDSKRASSLRNTRDSSSESGVHAKGVKDIVGSSREGKVLSRRRETRKQKTYQGDSSDSEESERKERRKRSGHKEERVESKEDRKIQLSVKDTFKSKTDTRNSQREDVNVSEAVREGFKAGEVEKADYGGWMSSHVVSTVQNHDDHDAAYASENMKRVPEKAEGVPFPWKPLESKKMEIRDVLGNESDDHHAVGSIPDTIGFRKVAEVDAGEIPNAQTGRDETKAERTEMQDGRAEASSSDFSLYGDIDLEDLRKRSKLEKITKDAGDGGHRYSRRKNRRHRETPSDTDGDHKKGGSHRKDRRHREPLSDSSGIQKVRSDRKDHQRKATPSDSESESLGVRKGRKRSRSPKQAHRQRREDGSTSTERRKTAFRRDDKTVSRTREADRKADRHSKKYSSDSERDDQKKRGRSPVNIGYKSKGRQISSNDESDRYAGSAKRPRRSKATRRSSSFSSWSSSSESDEHGAKDTKKYPRKREEKRSENAKSRSRRTDSDDSSSAAAKTKKKAHNRYK